MHPTEREIYPNDTLRLVAFEVRFPEVEDLQKYVSDFNAAVRAHFPVPGPVPQEVTLEMQPGQAPATTHRDVGTRRLDRERQRSTVLTPSNMVVDASLYERFEVFRSLVEFAVDALKKTVPVPAITRIGLRYIDEIEASELPEDSDWRHFIASHLLGPLYESENRPRETFTQSRFLQDNGTQLTTRYGVLQKPAVDRDGPLRIEGSSTGERFVIDLDSSWTPVDQTFPEFETEFVMERVDVLREPVRKFFEQSITENLRNEVLRRSK